MAELERRVFQGLGAHRRPHGPQNLAHGCLAGEMSRPAGQQKGEMATGCDESITTPARIVPPGMGQLDGTRRYDVADSGSTFRV
jgi:hypothetical protein